MKFSQLSKYFLQIESNSSRLTITHLLSELFKKLTPEEIEKTNYLLQGRVLPLYEKVEFGMAERMIIKAIISALNIDRSYFEKEFKKIGDLGKTVEIFKKQFTSFEETELDILKVYDDLYRLATSSGPGSQDVKINILATLIRQLDPTSSRYIVRIPQAVMRLGFSDMTVLDSYSWMLTGDKSIRPEIEKAYHVRPDLGFIGRQLKEKGIDGLKHVKPKVFTPIIMMRAERLSSGVEIIEQIGRCAVESKYDGFRLQIHYSKKRDEVRLYSRNLEETSFMYPDIVAGVKAEVMGDEVIFEGEAIGFNPDSGDFLPFQETVQRKRKYGIDEKAKEIPLKLFAFELLYLDGVSYIREPFEKRRAVLTNILNSKIDKNEQVIFISPQTLIDDGHKLELMFDQAISKGLEGIIAKKMDGIYQPGARGWNWIKFKRSYSVKIEDTIDCLVMGYDIGRGKRADFGIGAFLVGVYDVALDKFVTVAKIGTGLTDGEWIELKKRCDRFRTDKKPALYEADKMMDVDVWVKPDIIMEIRADEITRSPVHTAGRVMQVSKNGKAQTVKTAGFALRFPRLEKFREDKRPEEATALAEIEKMFNRQLQLKK